MKFKGTIGDMQSGSLAGIVASHNRGGTYYRERRIPVNPATSFQVAVRGFVSNLTSNWLNLLTEAERDAWDQYALNVLIPDALGDPRNVGGLGMYVRSNVPRLQAALPRVDVAPTVFNLGEFTDPVVGVIDGTADTLSLAFTNSDDWANEDDSGLTVFGSRGQNASINYFKGPYRFAAVIEGGSVTPPTSPAVIALPFNVAAGQRVFVQARVTRADGRLSSPFRGFNLAT